MSEVTDPNPSPTTAATTEGKAPDLVRAVENLIAKHGDSSSALRVLMGENYTLRDANRELKGKMPADGSVILSGDDAKEWGAYRNLGKPSDLRKTIEEHGAYGSKLATLERDAEVRSFMDAAGLDPKKAAGFRKLIGDARPERKVEKDPKTGKDVETLTVRDGESEPVPMDRYLADHGFSVESFRPDAQQAARSAGTPPRVMPPRDYERAPAGINGPATPIRLPRL